MSTPTQSRLLALAKHHPHTRGRWPEGPAETFHHHVTPSRAVSIYTLRPGHGHLLVWICGANDDVITYATREDALAYARRVITDLEALGDTP